MKRQTFLTVPLVPMTTIGAGIISCEFDWQPVEFAQLPL
jgi:hypothetical protein